jgi:hypothetical protein
MAVALAVMAEVKGLIVGESAAPQLRSEIEAFVAAQPEVDQVLNVITLAWGERIVIADGYVAVRCSNMSPRVAWKSLVYEGSPKP